MNQKSLPTFSSSVTHFLNLDRSLLADRPPYQLRDMRMIYVGGHWSEGATLPALPKGLSVTEGRHGVLGIYVASNGREIGPIALAFGSVVVRETWVPDGTQAAFTFHGVVEGPKAMELSRHINNAYLPGQVRIDVGAEDWEAEARCPEGRIAIAVKADPDSPRQVASDTNYYMGLIDGATAGTGVAYSCPFRYGAITKWVIDLPDSHPMAVFRDFVADLVMVIEDMEMTYGAPYALDLATPERGSTLAEHQDVNSLVMSTLSLFAPVGRGLVVIEDSGRILYANPAADTLLGKLAYRGMERIGRQMASAKDPVPPEGLFVQLPLREGGEALARVVPIRLKLFGKPAFIVLLDDPRAVGPFDPISLLRLQGLTPSEARLAALIGQGQSPAAAAKALQITSETARTMLKAVFLKLGINRQAELARLVTRFEML